MKSLQDLALSGVFQKTETFSHRLLNPVREPRSGPDKWGTGRTNAVIYRKNDVDVIFPK